MKAPERIDVKVYQRLGCFTGFPGRQWWTDSPELRAIAQASWTRAKHLPRCCARLNYSPADAPAFRNAKVYP